jgi:hypothetical protein
MIHRAFIFDKTILKRYEMTIKIFEPTSLPAGRFVLEAMKIFIQITCGHKTIKINT